MENKLTKYLKNSISDAIQDAIEYYNLDASGLQEEILRHVRNNLSIHSLKNAKINNLIKSELEEKLFLNI